MNYIITGGTGFIGTHLTNLIKELEPQARVYNLDIVKPGTPNPVVKDYKPALREGQTLRVRGADVEGHRDRYIDPLRGSRTMPVYHDATFVNIRDIAQSCLRPNINVSVVISTCPSVL